MPSTPSSLTISDNRELLSGRIKVSSPNSDAADIEGRIPKRMQREFQVSCSGS